MAGRRSRHRMRCRQCRRDKRAHYDFTIKRAPEKYKRAIKCPVCKSDDVYSREHTYVKAQAKREICYCYGVPHPHRKGTHRLCEFHPLADVPLTNDEEWHAMQVADNRTRTSNR